MHENLSMRAPILVLLLATIVFTSAQQGPWSKIIPQINWADVHWGCTLSCAKWYAAGRLITKPKNCDCEYIAVRSLTDNIWDDIGKVAKREAQKELKRGEEALKKEGERLLKEEAKNLKRELGLDALSDYEEMIDKLSKRSKIQSDNIWDNLAKRAKQEAEKELKRGESALKKEGERLLKEEAKNLKKELDLDAMSDGVWDDFQKTLEKNGITMENFKEQMYTKIKAEIGKEIDIAEDAVIEYAKNYLKEKFSEAATNVKNKIAASKAPAAAPAAAKSLSDSKLTEEQEAELRRIIDEQTAVLKKGSLLGLTPSKTLADQTNEEESDNIWDDLAKVAKKEAEKELKRGEATLKKEGERLLKEEAKNLKKELGLDALGDTDNIWDNVKKELKNNGIDVNAIGSHVKEVTRETGAETAIASRILIDETVRLIKEDLKAGKVDNAEARLNDAKEGAKDIGEAVKLKVLEELEKARQGLKKKGIDVADIVEKLLNKYSAMADQIDPNYSFTQELYKLIPEVDWKKVNGPCTIDCAVYWLTFKHWGEIPGCECEKLAVKNISDPNYVPYQPPPAQQEQQPQPPAGVPMAPKRNSLVERSYEHKELADVSQRLRDVIRGVNLDRLNGRCTVACAKWNFSLRKGPKPRVPGCDCDSPLRG